MLVVDAETLCVVEANAEAARRFAVDAGPLAGRRMLELVDEPARGPLGRLLLAAPEGAGTIEARLRLRHGTPECDVAVTSIAGGPPLWLLRVQPLLSDVGDAGPANPGPFGAHGTPRD